MIEVQPDLEVDELTVQFGGLVAVDGVSLHASAGAITGLIGPNGAGKTTIFNACTGVVPCHRGEMRLGPCDLGNLSTASRASNGLGRTFQRMELFDSMTVSENVALGPRPSSLPGVRGANLPVHVTSGATSTPARSTPWRAVGSSQWRANEWVISRPASGA